MSDNQKLRDAKKNAEALYWSMSTAQKGIRAALEYMASALQSQPQAPEAGVDDVVHIITDAMVSVKGHKFTDLEFGRQIERCEEADSIIKALATAGYLAKQDNGFWGRSCARLQQRNKQLEAALRYWLPDETLIPEGHEDAWYKSVAALGQKEADNG